MIIREMRRFLCRPLFCREKGARFIIIYARMPLLRGRIIITALYARGCKSRRFWQLSERIFFFFGLKIRGFLEVSFTYSVFYFDGGNSHHFWKSDASYGFIFNFLIFRNKISSNLGIFLINFLENLCNLMINVQNLRCY